MAQWINLVLGRTQCLGFRIAAFSVLLSGMVSAQSITGFSPPTDLIAGQTYSVSVNSTSASPSIVAVQLFDPNWDLVDQSWVQVPAGSTSHTFSFPVPGDATEAEGYVWQGVLYEDVTWERLDAELVLNVNVTVSGPAITGFNPTLEVTPGETYPITLHYTAASPSIVAVQLFDPNWNLVDQRWTEVTAGSTSHTFSFPVPSSTAEGNGYLWQAVLYDDAWNSLDNEFALEVRVLAGTSGPNLEWLPPGGDWVMDWNDEFEGTGEPDQWYPMLGFDPDSFANANEKGLRWSGTTADTSWMFSTRSGNHWLDGNGNLVMQITSNANEILVNGPKVEAAYLMSGFPEAWDNSEPNIYVRWGGKLVSPVNGPLYISARVRTDEVIGYSTWFAFWVFSQTRAYNSNPVDGSEVDIVEIAKGMPDYMRTAFNVANHISLDSSQSESLQLNTGTTPTALSFVDVTENAYHTYGLRWSQDSMTCYVDGIPYYTFTENIPSDPVDMMMMLTLEFQKNLWDANAGDGRFEGPFIDDQNGVRVMSRACIDYVRVYQQQ